MKSNANFHERVADGLANKKLADSLNVLETSRSLHYKLAFDALDNQSVCDRREEREGDGSVERGSIRDAVAARRRIERQNETQAQKRETQPRAH